MDDYEYDEEGFYCGDPHADAWREYNQDIRLQLMDIGYIEGPDGSLIWPEEEVGVEVEGSPDHLPF